MTAAAFAELVHARPTRRGRWQAKCLAHPDKSPSLTITEGREGRVLVRCWAGCSLPSILAALGLTMRDMFSGEQRTPAQAQRARRERAVRNAEARQQAEQERKLADILRRAGFAVDAIAGKLARIGDGQEVERAERLTKLFHLALDWERAAEAGFGYS